jgi:hypothetical protein
MSRSEVSSFSQVFARPELHDLVCGCTKKIASVSWTSASAGDIQGSYLDTGGGEAVVDGGGDLGSTGGIAVDADGLG